MDCLLRRLTVWGAILISSSSLPGLVHSQNSVSVSHPATPVTILDSSKAQDGLSGSVRRVKTEFAKLEVKDGRLVEGTRQLIEVTTYDLDGKRIENASYPITNTAVGKEEYQYDEKGNIVGMTMRGEGGSILSRETYSYEFDRFGNWTKMVTSLVVFESGSLRQEPVEVTYRSLTYYFDNSVAKIVDSSSNRQAPELPERTGKHTLNRASQFAKPDRLSRIELPSALPIALTEQPPQYKSSSLADKKPLRATSETQPEKLRSDGVPSSRNESVILSTPEASPSERTATGSVGPNGPVPKYERTTPSATSNSAPKASLEFYKTGRERFDNGDVKGAVDAYLRSIELEPKSAEVYLSLGQAYLKLNKERDAARAFKESTRLNPELAEAYYGLALTAFRMGHYRDAQTAFKRTTVLRFELAKAHYGLALTYQELGNESGVIEEYRILQNLDKALAKQLAQAFPNFDLPCRVPPYCK